MEPRIPRNGMEQHHPCPEWACSQHQSRSWPRFLKDSSTFRLPMSPPKVRSALGTVVTSVLNLGHGGCDRRCRPHLLWKVKRAHCTTIAQSIFQSLTSICSLRLVFVSPYFVFFFSDEWLLSSWLSSSDRQGWGLGGDSTPVGFLPGLLFTLLF